MGDFDDKFVSGKSLTRFANKTKEYIDNAVSKIDTDNLVVTNSISMSRKEGTTVGEKSVAVGYNTTASSYYSYAEGTNTKASGYASHAEGSNTEASSYASHAEGHYAEASGDFSHAEGFATTASGDYSHAEGVRTIASSESQHVQGRFNIEDSTNTYAHIVGNGEDVETDEGEQVIIYSNAHTLDWNGNAWYAGDVYVGGTSQDIDSKKLATEEYVDEAVANVSGGGTDVDLTDLVITNSISMGRKANTTVGEKSVAVGIDVEASGNYSHAEGDNTTASNSYSHAEGGKTTSSGIGSHAEGYETTASADTSHAEGYCTTASASCSHAEGQNTTASGGDSHAEGYYTTASGYASHTEGNNTIASSNYQHVQGKYNIEDTANTYAHIVGNGSSSARRNAHTLDWSGNAWFAGNIKVGANNKELATKEYVDTHSQSAHAPSNAQKNSDITQAEIENKLTGLIGSHHHDWSTTKGTNTISSTSNDTTSNWGAQGHSIHWYTATGQLIDQPNQWGFLLNIGQSSEVHQLWMTQASGSLYHRGGNGSGWSGSWREILDSNNYSKFAFPLTGGSINGDVAINGDLDMNGSIYANYVTFSNILDISPFNDQELGDRTYSPGYGSIYCKYDTGETNVTYYADGYLSAGYVDWIEFYGTETRWYRDYIVTTGNFVPYGSNTYTLGTASLRWKTVYSNNSLNTSDRSDKENINYIRNNGNDTRVLASDVDESKAPDITYSNLYEFVRDDLELATYNIKTSSEDEEENKTDINFIAQDLLYNLDGTDNTIGQLIVPPIPAPTDEEAKKYGEVDEKGNKVCTPPALSYDVGNYISVLAGALKESINKIEKQQETIDYLLSIIENK